MSRKITQRISDQAHRHLDALFTDSEEGLSFLTESFPRLYRETLAEVKGKFTLGDLYLLIDAFEGTTLSPENACTALEGECASGILQEGLDVKWRTDPELLLQTIRELTAFQVFCIEIWAMAYWKRHSRLVDSDLDLEDHIKPLL